MDCSLSGFSVHGILQARIQEWVAIAFPRGSFPTQELNLGVLHCRQMIYQLSYVAGARWKGLRLRRRVEHVALPLLGTYTIFEPFTGALELRKCKALIV